MKIKSISIKNFKAIAGTLNFDFTDSSGNPLDLVVLTGPNGCGKTSVLEACMIVIDRGYLINQDNTRISIHEGENNCALEAVVFDNGNETQMKRTARTYDEIQYECKIDRGYDRHGHMIGTMESFVYHASPQTTLKDNGYVYFSSWRWNRLVGSLSPSAADTKLISSDEHIEENRLKNIKQYLLDARLYKDFETTEGDQPATIYKILNRIGDAWRLFYPNNISHFEVEPAGQIGEGYDVFYKIDESKTGILIDKFSSGEIEIFTMLGWFAIHDFSNGIIFIDEPELHLHPKWQRIILKAIQKVAPGVQIIAATHSPLVLSSVEPQSIKMIEHPDVIKQSGQFERSAPSPDASYGLDANQILNFMNVPERPPEILSMLSELFDLIDQNKLDQAKSVLTGLYEKIHVHDDPDLILADTIIRRKETIGR